MAQQQQLQYRPVAVEILQAVSTTELADKITAALASGKVLHGNWKVVSNALGGTYFQAVCSCDWCPMPPLPESQILTPRPGSIVG